MPQIKSFKSGIQLNKWELLVTCCKLFIFSLQLNSNIFFCSWFTTVFETVLLFCFVRMFHFLCIWRTIIVMLGIFIIVYSMKASLKLSSISSVSFCINIFISSLLNRRFDDEGEWEFVSKFVSNSNLPILSKISWNRFLFWSKLITVFFLLILRWFRIERTRYIQVTGFIIFRNHIQCISQIVQPFHQSGSVHVQLRLRATIARLVTFWIMFYTKHSSKVNQKC